jgi:hypothetical protein
MDAIRLKKGCMVAYGLPQPRLTDENDLFDY